VDSSLSQVAPHFARHETFHPRFGWFSKGVAAVAVNPGVFSSDEATIALGVGKNMVSAIRFWGRAAKVIEDDASAPGTRFSRSLITNNGRLLLDMRQGLDPYLELAGSLWLLHWWMLSPRCVLPVWWIAFNMMGAVEFGDDELCETVSTAVERVPTWARPSHSSLSKDVDCLIRMYTAGRATRSTIDDILDCPFRELGLIKPSWADQRRYRFQLGPKPTLPHAITAYACIRFIQRDLGGAQTATLSRLVSAPGSPGRVFKLTEDALLQSLEAHATAQPEIQVVVTGGVAQVVFRGDPNDLALGAIGHYYGKHGRSLPSTGSLADPPIEP
jgi:hypothetical protein